MKLNDMMRAQHVKRFHIVNTTKSQSVAEHSFNVALLAREIAIKMGFDSENIDKVTLAAMFHDMDEVITGDIPTPTKLRFKEKGVDLNNNGIEVPYQSGSDSVNRIVKIADYIEAAWFLEENGSGRHAESVLADIDAKMEEFIQSTFSLKEATSAYQVLQELNQAEFTI